MPTLLSTSPTPWQTAAPTAKSTPFSGSFSDTRWWSPRPNTEMAIPVSVTSMATMLAGAIASPKATHAAPAAAKGASVMNSWP